MASEPTTSFSAAERRVKKPITPQPTGQATWDELQSRLKELERRDWRLWMTAVAVMFLLTVAVLVVAWPVLVRPNLGPWQGIFDFNLRQGLGGLIGLVLLFTLHLIYQQILIKRLRRNLAAQINATASTELRAETFHQLAMRDHLTGLYNRRFIEEHMPTEFARATRCEYALTLLMLDVNDLHEINARYGHSAGDLVLTEFARHLSKMCRGSDLAARIGGDEFMLLLPECLPGQVPILLARLTGLEVSIAGTKIPVEFSAGWAEHQTEDTAEQLLDRAAHALYSEKRSGKVDEEIRQAQKMATVGQLTSSVAHDLTNLLMVVQSYSEMLLEEQNLDARQRKQLGEIGKASQRATTLTRQLLAFSRKQSIAPQPLSLNDVILDVEAILRRLVGDKVMVDTQLDDTLGWTRADRSQLEQIVLNLAVNARDAMPDGGMLTIATANAELDETFARTHPGARAGKYVMVRVTDTGCGMDAATKARIFEPFFTTKEVGKGTGLGLSTVYGIVKQSAGYIWVDSEVGQGSTFSVYLPRAVMEKAATQ